MNCGSKGKLLFKVLNGQIKLDVLSLGIINNYIEFEKFDECFKMYEDKKEDIKEPHTIKTLSICIRFSIN